MSPRVLQSQPDLCSVSAKYYFMSILIITNYITCFDRTSKNLMLACCNNITVTARNLTEFSMEHVLAFSMERVLAFSIECVLVQNALQLTRNFGIPLAFPQSSILRSVCVPVTHSVLGYFCPVLYIKISTQPMKYWNWLWCYLTRIPSFSVG